MSDMEHHHHHHHHHDHESVLPEPELDPGNRALADALRLVFGVLKLCMLGIVVLFVWSGLFEVDQNEVALILRFGKINGTTPQKAILEPGLHWRWPYVDEIVRIPASSFKRTLDVDSFWYFQTEEEKAGVRQTRARPRLEIVRDGYSLTASRGAQLDVLDDQSPSTEVSVNGDDIPVTDYNIVHSKWRIRYNINDPIAFFAHLWDGTEGLLGQQSGWHGVEEVLQCVLADAVIMVSANRDISWMIWDKPVQFRRDVEEQFLTRLAELDTGLSASLEVIDVAPPLQVKPAFDDAASAKTRADQMILGSEAKAREIVSAAEADRDILVAEARAYATSVVESAQADARYLSDVLAKIEQTVNDRVAADSPAAKQKREQLTEELIAVTVDQLYQEMTRSVVADADEVFVLQASDDATVEWRPSFSRSQTLKKQPPKKKEGRLYEHQWQPVGEQF